MCFFWLEYDIIFLFISGAKMTFVGRPALYGLGTEGQSGVENVLKILKSELISIIGMCGANGMQDIKEDMVIKATSSLTY